MDKFYAVFCLQEVDDSTIAEGKYVLATSRLFRSEAKAEKWMGPIDPGRKPIVWFVGDKMQQVAELLDRTYKANE